MIFFNWLKEWAPVLTLVATVAIAVILGIIARQRWLADTQRGEISKLRDRQRRELTELIEWANRAIPLKEEYDNLPMGSLELKNLVTKILTIVAEYDRMSTIVKNFKASKLGKGLKEWFDNANGNLKLLMSATNAKLYKQGTRTEPSEYAYAFQTLINIASNLKTDL